MVLPLILGALGGALGTAGTLGTIGALGGAAIGSGLGTYAQTGDLEKGILSGLGAYAGGALLGPVLGGAGGAGAAGTTGAAGAAAPASAAGSLTGQTAAATAAPYATAVPGPGVTGLGVPKPVGAVTAGMPKGVGGIAGLGKNAFRFAMSPQGAGVGIGSAIGSSFSIPGSDSGSGSDRPRGTGFRPYSMELNKRPEGYNTNMGEFNYGFKYPSLEDFRSQSNMARGGLVKRMQEGGIASLTAGGADMERSGGMPAAGNDKEIVANAIRAIKGKSDRAEIALGAFLARYGEAALRDLVDSVRSESKRESEETDDMDDDDEDEGRVTGPGDGMSDMVPANIENDEDVLLSDGEFVISADVVSAIGNGSSDAGAKALQNMMDRVRSMKNGSPKQPPRIPQEKMLPA